MIYDGTRTRAEDRRRSLGRGSEKMGEREKYPADGEEGKRTSEASRDSSTVEGWRVEGTESRSEARIELRVENGRARRQGKIICRLTGCSFDPVRCNHHCQKIDPEEESQRKIRRKEQKETEGKETREKRERRRRSAVMTEYRMEAQGINYGTNNY